MPRELIHSRKGNKEMYIIAHIENDYSEKFGVPRQSGLVNEVLSRIVFEPEFRNPDALRGLEEFSHIWLIWEFSKAVRHSSNIAKKTNGEYKNFEGTSEEPTSRNVENDASSEKTQFVCCDWRPTVRPPRLGGNERMGVFATRSPFRPNPIGLSCVELDHIEYGGPEGPVIVVRGADLMNGTPIYDIKPYIPYADCKVGASGGFTESAEKRTLRAELPQEVVRALGETAAEELRGVLEQDPRPAYQDSPDKVYRFTFAGRQVSFRVEDGTAVDVRVD